MLLEKFRGGVHPPDAKILTSGKPIKRLPAPQKVSIPLHQYVGAPCKPIVSSGAIAQAGDMIAQAGAFITAPIHASIAGKVTKIANFPHPVFASVAGILIERQEDSVDANETAARADASSLTPEQLGEIIKNAGVAGMGGAGFPTYVKLSPPKNEPIDTVIINGAECGYGFCDL